MSTVREGRVQKADSRGETEVSARYTSFFRMRHPSSTEGGQAPYRWVRQASSQASSSKGDCRRARSATASKRISSVSTPSGSRATPTMEQAGSAA